VAFKARLRSALLPLFASLFAVLIASRVFTFSGEATSALWLSMKLVFAFSIFILVMLGVNLIENIRKKKTIIYKT
jgi:hypothetical protein